ncbi:MAG: transcription antitermination factor NusB [Bacteroidaceae bacterium]|nr:transcription antitermination factor NusB [Bacteroidaceae bacterium]
MINRVLIRLKIIQIVYAYYQNGSNNLDAAEKELLFSLSKAYDLYNFLLLLMVDLTECASRRIENAKLKNLATEDDLKPNMRFINNKFMAQLQTNKMLYDYQERQKRSWLMNHEEFVKQLLDKIQNSELYEKYMAKAETTYLEDREFWRSIYKTFINKNEELEGLLEEMSLYWNDDKEIVDTFVLKTINRFNENSDADFQLLPEYKDEEDRTFAVRLLRRSILNCNEYRKMVSDNTRNWDINRVAFMDVIIMQVALAEILSFSNIPVSVSLNEYVEIAKYYSTPKSGSFVNGTLDGIVKRLRKEGKITKK